MKKLLSKICVMAVLAAMLLSATAAAAQIGTGEVTGDALRMRSAPSTSSTTMTYLYRGNQVQILEKLDGWYKATWQGRTGYLSADYVRFTPNAQEAPAVSAAPAAAETPAERIGTVSGTNVNFRSGPSTGYGILAVMDIGTQLTILSKADGWYKALLNGQEGYVSADYVTESGQAAAAAAAAVPDSKGVVTGDCVNVRSGPSTSYSVVTRVYEGEVVTLRSLQDGWYAVSCDRGEGYIRADYIGSYTGQSTRSVTPTANADGQSIADKAQEYLGVPYAYGGASSKGFDCSGFTMYVCKLFGYSLPHSATSQWNSLGTSVAKEDLQPGDLVFFNDTSISNGKACSHVGIYIGDGEFVHAASGSSGRYVRISDLSESYYSRYYKGARRLG